VGIRRSQSLRHSTSGAFHVSNVLGATVIAAGIELTDVITHDNEHVRFLRLSEGGSRKVKNRPEQSE